MGENSNRSAWLWGLAGTAMVVVVLAVVLFVVRDTDHEAPPPDTTPPTAIATLTGLPLDGPERPALAVKIDNVDAARPQTGLAAADVIVEAMVEGGLTRLTAIYSSTDPGAVGPVRSVRVTDLRFVGLLGRPAFAFSGGAEPVVRQAEDLAAEGGVVLLSEASTPTAFSRRADRAAPHNLYADAADLWAAAPDAEQPGPLLAFGPAAPSTPVSGVRVPFPSARVDYVWDEARRQWVRSQDGRPHLDEAEPNRTLGFTNVVVLQVVYRPAAHDERSPAADLSTGGQAWIFRNGSMANCRWSTDSSATPRIDLRTEDGAICALEPGRTLLELSPGAPEPATPAPDAG
jgi:hypothetical protein